MAARRRDLTLVPIIHTEADMGDLKEALRERYVREFGEEKWKEHLRIIDEFWTGIEAAVLGLDLDPARLKLYQDGLPVCGREEAIVRELAGRGSRNHMLLVRLMDRGATLVGTESAKLLVEEYRQVRAALSRPDPSGGDALLEKRDRFIARRIDASLGEGERGILFIGLRHDVGRRLPESIRVNDLIHRLPFAHDVGRRLSAARGGRERR